MTQSGKLKGLNRIVEIDSTEVTIQIRFLHKLTTIIMNFLFVHLL